MTQAERVRYVIDAFESGNSSEFARKVGISKYAVSRMCNGKASAAPHAVAIARAYPLVSPLWIVSGEGDPPMHLSELERVEKMARELRRELKKLNKRLDEVERQHKEIMEMFRDTDS